MMYVVIAIFVVVMAAALVVLLGMAIGAFSAMFTGLRDDIRGKKSAAQLEADTSTRASVSTSADPLADLADTLRLAQARRWASCKAVRDRLNDDRPTAADEADRLVDVALDIWCNRSAERRAVDVGSADDASTPIHRREHAEGAIDRFSTDPVGQIAWTTAAVADRIGDLPAWRLDFFDRHSVRVDLAAEVTAITNAAVGLRDQFSLLGDAPSGHLRSDPDVVSTFAEKSLLLSGRLDELVRRLEAFAGYAEIVERIQHRQEKQEWLDRVGGIDEFEHVVATEWDRAEADRVRHLADESDVLASIYLDEIAPLAKSLERD